MASQFGRYGYRTVTDLLNREGWRVGKDAVYTVWREEGLKVPQKQPKRARLWLVDGSCIRLKPMHRNHVWSYDFVHDRTHDGKPFRILNIIDEYSRECLASVVKRRWRAQDVILLLADLFLEHGCPQHIRSDNGPEFVAKKLVKWLSDLEVGPLFIHPGSPWRMAMLSRLTVRCATSYLDGEIFYSLMEAKVIIERWRRHYNKERPHSSLGGKSPETIQPNLKRLDIHTLTM